MYFFSITSLIKIHIYKKNIIFTIYFPVLN